MEREFKIGDYVKYKYDITDDIHDTKGYDEIFTEDFYTIKNMMIGEYGTRFITFNEKINDPHKLITKDGDVYYYADYFKFAGRCGTSGWSGHADYGGCGYIKIEDNYPSELKDMIDLRNKSMDKEWWDAIRGRNYFSGGADTLHMADEITRKGLDAIDKDLNLIKEKYKIIDEEIFKKINKI